MKENIQMYRNMFSDRAWYLAKQPNDETSLHEQSKSVEVNGILCELGKYRVETNLM